jgi:hypothetical protein
MPATQVGCLGCDAVRYFNDPVAPGELILVQRVNQRKARMGNFKRVK